MGGLLRIHRAKPLVRLSPNSYGIVLVVGEVAASGVAAVLAVDDVAVPVARAVVVLLMLLSC